MKKHTHLKTVSRLMMKLAMEKKQYTKATEREIPPQNSRQHKYYNEKKIINLL